MLKEWVLIALLTTGEPIQELATGEDCHAIYDAISEGIEVSRKMEDGSEVALRMAACIPLDVFNSISTGRRND